jgi:site-specific recombinase XerD
MTSSSAEFSLSALSLGFAKLRIPTFLLEVTREAVLNALTDRDYAIADHVRIRGIPQNLVVTSPGRLTEQHHATETLRVERHRWFYRIILMTLYATRVRRSELTRVKISDIDSARMVLDIEGGKGRKDRDVTEQRKQP